ncbi:MAG: acetyl-CoA carboxylase biotin carboxyl carrier protein [Labilithrix sp.]|nr:acetyl-CoA carboxylase biotin carboxyl carrier protein [Labilithrix sp.]MCW5813602.1 acetyl-CoA carboxylase biotin carboxyl carrier protein [Labilithrix sp.]
MTVDIDKLKALLAVLAEENVSEFEHEAEGVRVRVVRGATGQLVPQMMMAPPMSSMAPMSAPTPTSPATAVETATPADSIDVTSPFVGTFYRSPSPDAPAFCDVGSVVRPGQTLCIIEAMKLMNEIEAELSGTIVEIYAQNGKAVEFGQKLFRIKKA